MIYIRLCLPNVGFNLPGKRLSLVSLVFFVFFIKYKASLSQSRTYPARGHVHRLGQGPLRLSVKMHL